MSKENMKTTSGEPLSDGLKVDHEFLDKIFTLGLIAFVSVLVVKTVEYSHDARIFPLVVLVPMMLLLVGQLAVRISDQLAEIADTFSGPQPLGSGSFGTVMDSSEVETNLETIRKNAVVILLWMVFLSALIVVVGHVVGIFTFLLFIYYFYGEQSPRRTLTYTLINTAFIVLLFLVGLNAQLYGGLLGLEIRF